MTFEGQLAALRDADYLVRLRGIYALVARDPTTNEPTEPGNPRFVEPLLALADDPTKNVRTTVAWTLQLIASTEEGNEAKNCLRAALEAPSWRVRFAVARAWPRIQQLAPLLPLLSDDVESVRWAAASAVASRNNRPLFGGRSFDPESLRPLLLALSDPAPTVRAAAIRGLEPGDNDEAYFALNSALRDGDYRVRLWPAGRLREVRAVPALIDALEDPHPWVRWNVARTLGEIADIRAVDPLVRQLDGKNRDTRCAAARALGSIGDPRAVAPLEALRDRSTGEFIRRTAVHAIDAILRGSR